MDRRPTGVVLIAVLGFLYGLVYLLGAIVFLAVALDVLSFDFLAAFRGLAVAVGIVLLLFAVAYIGVSWGLLDLREWGRLGAIIVSVLHLIGYVVGGVGQIVGWDIGGMRISSPGGGVASLILGAIAGGIIYYLLRPDVRQAFVAGSTRVITWNGDGPRSTPMTQPVTPQPMALVQPLPNIAPRPTEVFAPPIPVVAWLVPKGPGRGGRQFPLQSARAEIGRDGGCVVCLDDSTISNRHAAIVFENNRFILADLASRNGTFLNGQRIQRQMLYDNDEIRIGSTVLIFKKV